MPRATNEGGNAGTICERLRHQNVLVNGETITVDFGDGPMECPTGGIVQVRNPDGPEAADIIDGLCAALSDAIELLRAAGYSTLEHTAALARARGEA